MLDHASTRGSVSSIGLFVPLNSFGILIGMVGRLKYLPRYNWTKIVGLNVVYDFLVLIINGDIEGRQ